MKKAIFNGSGVAIVTPLNADMSVNYPLLAELIEMQINGGTDAVIIMGTTGEASTMTDEEHLECIRFTVEKVAGRVPVIAGTGSNDTSYAIELSVSAEKVGADALLVVSPYYNKTSQRGLVKHFTAIADAVNIPIILYNIPGRTNINISIETFKELAKHPNIVAVKESGGDVGYLIKILKNTDLIVYSGDDAMTVPFMSLGARGVISVAANIVPDIMHKICELCLNNDFKAAGELQLEYSDLMSSLFIDVNPIPVKEALNQMGYNVGECRLPLCSMEAAQVEVLKNSLRSMKLI